MERVDEATNGCSKSLKPSFCCDAGFILASMGRDGQENSGAPDGHAEPASPASTIPLIDTDVDNVSN